MTVIFHWIWWHLGLSNNGPWYAFWSGFGSDLAEFAIVGVVYRKVNCHDARCWRIGLHHVEGTPYTTCRKHHPVIDAPVRAAHIHAAFHRAKRGNHE